MKRSWLLSLVVCGAVAWAGEDYKPDILPASDEAAQAIKTFQLPAGMQAELVAAEPQLANPVAIYVDFKSRIYVCETFRAGLTCVEGGPLLDQDLAIRTCDERLAFMQRNHGDLSRFSQNYERLRLLQDTDGDGRTDKDTVFFKSNGVLDGITAGALAYRGDVYWANVPNLWHLQDADGDGVADASKVMHYGFGVRGGIRGHDLHGLRIGPDGKLYMSIGDRGVHVETPQKTVAFPDTGGVLRCNLDGSDLEVFATGLRNPQDLIFDEYGNLFTNDNDSGGTDQCRLMYIPEGGECGWRNAYQFIQPPLIRGMWNLEKLWHAPFKGQAAYVIPAINHFTNGPSGITYYPGTGWPDHFKRRFFLVDFRYSAAGSCIYSFHVTPKGAGFVLANLEKSIWNILTTDADFGPDSCLYISDWVAGGEMPKKGRIYRIFDPALRNSPVVRETQQLLANGLEQKSIDELRGLLGHVNQHVRQEAQFELVRRGKPAIDAFKAAVQPANQLLARIHAIWGLGQLARANNNAAKVLVPLLADGEAEVRAQAAKTIGDVRHVDGWKKLLPLLKDDVSRVRYFAAISLGKLQREDALPALLELLRTNNDEDPYIRHAAVMGLIGSAPEKALLKHLDDQSVAVRLGLIVALRRMESAAVARFLDDPDPLVVIEAVRAIHDVPIAAAMPALAEKLNRVSSTADAADAARQTALFLRLNNANYRLGTDANAQALVKLALRVEVAPAMRADALSALATWANPGGRDRVLNMWRPVPPRDGSAAAAAVRPALAALLDDPAPMVRTAAVQVALAHKIAEVSPKLRTLVADEQQPLDCRIGALDALGIIGDAELHAAISAALATKEVKLRQSALTALASLKPDDAIPLLKKAIEKGAVGEKQTAIGLLPKFKRPDVKALLDGLLDTLLAGKLQPELQVDVLESALEAGEFKDKLAAYENSLNKDDELAPFKVCLTGGDNEDGKKIFYENHKVQCLRCHKINNKGGEVGPDLKGIAAKYDRNYLLQALIQPNEQIAEGYELNLVTLNDGVILTGNVGREDDKVLILRAADGKTTEVAKDQIKTRKRQKASAMPPMGEQLTKREIRDLVEFLARLK